MHGRTEQSSLPNFYEILNVDELASDIAIKEAFQKLTKDSRFEQGSKFRYASRYNFKQLLEAYETLSNADKREDYDTCLMESNLSLIKSDSRPSQFDFAECDFMSDFSATINIKRSHTDNTNNKSKAMPDLKQIMRECFSDCEDKYDDFSFGKKVFFGNLSPEASTEFTGSPMTHDGKSGEFTVDCLFSGLKSDDEDDVKTKVVPKVFLASRKIKKILLK